MIEIDGKEGGGQILRSALSLSVVTGQAFRMKNIRGKRAKGGLKRQHLTCVQAAVEISNGSADGAELNSTELVFRPGAVQAGDYHFKIGTAGSTMLLLQTLLPALWSADEASTLVLEGGTHNPMAPSFDFMDRAFLPQLAKMGVQVELELERYGFAPSGGGHVRAVIQPCEQLRGHDWQERGVELSRRLQTLAAHIPESVAEREIVAARQLFDVCDSAVESVVTKESDGPGNVVFCEVVYENVTEHSTSYGEHGVRSEQVGKVAAKGIHRFAGSKAAMGTRLADQLLLPLALAGEGSLHTIAMTNHIRTNLIVLEQFLQRSFSVDEAQGGSLRLALV